MRIAAAVLLGICALLTIWLIKEDLGVAGHYTGWGVPNMTQVMLILFWRWAVLSVGFSLLVASGSLVGWAPWGPLRAVFVLGGLLFFEISSFFLHSVFADENVIFRYRAIFAVAATLLALCVIASGFMAIRWLFVVSVVASMVMGIYGNAGETTFMHVKKPFVATDNPNLTMGSVLLSANPMYEPEQLAEVFGWIEKQPDWIGQVTKELDGNNHLSAMYTLCRQPARLDEVLQERCWTAIGAATAELDREMKEHEGHATISEALKLAEAVKGMATLPGPLRDKHRAEFLAAEKYLNEVGKDSVLVRRIGKLGWASK